MSDDLANAWGCNLVEVDNKRKRGSATALLGDVSDKSEFSKLIASTIGTDFVLDKLTPNGSDANLYAITSLTEGDTNLCLVACGSYVAGDKGPLQSWSTSGFSVKKGGPCAVLNPANVPSPFTRSHAIPLPYCIPGTMTDDDFERYEDRCLKFLHKRLLVAKMKGAAIKAIFLELMLGGNGAYLPASSLDKLGLMASHHGFQLIVDEIMTAGRCGEMIISPRMPDTFKSNIAYITMGKWLKCGLVLIGQRQDYNLKLKTLDLPRRGTSTDLCHKEPMTYWKAVADNLHLTQKRHEDVLRSLNLNSGDTWGGMLLIFASGRRQGIASGLLCRFLPKLTPTPIDRGIQVSEVEAWSKQNVNDDLVASMDLWCDKDLYCTNEDDEALYYLATSLGIMYEEGDAVQTSRIAQMMGGNEQYNERAVCRYCRMAEAAGLLEKVLKTEKRLNYWVIQAPMTLPFKSGVGQL